MAMDLPARVGRYEVERLLGQGATWRVLLARDPVLGRPVALEILRDDLGLGPDAKAQLTERARHEARAVSVLSHPSMVALHDMGDDPAVGLYLVLELVRGPTLRQRLAQGPLVPAEVAQIARALGAVLTHAHAAGIVHRDVRPENVLLAPTGPRLADFGIARLPDPGPAGDAAAYSAPEVLASGAFTAYGDEFALATTLYEALTGTRAFPGTDAAAVASRIATAKHQAPTAVAPRLKGFVHLDTIFDRALAKEAKNRFSSCEMFATVLASEIEGANMFLPTPASQASIVPRATRRWQNTIGVVAVLVIVALITLGRQRQVASDGVSLKSVASEFAAAAAPLHGPAPGRRPRPAASAGTPPQAADVGAAPDAAAVDP